MPLPTPGQGWHVSGLSRRRDRPAPLPEGRPEPSWRTDMPVSGLFSVTLSALTLSSGAQSPAGR
jgi:hypothetical protein